MRVNTKNRQKIKFFKALLNLKKGERKKLPLALIMYVSTVFLLRTEVYFNSSFSKINYSRYSEYEFKRNAKEVQYIEDSILDKRKFGVFKACFTERLAD